MRLKKFINESKTKLIMRDDIDQLDMEKKIEKSIKIINMIVSDCKPYLDEIKKLRYEKYLFSGRKNEEIVFRENIRKDRFPKDTHIEIHDMLDDEFEKKFGWRPRSQSLFCTGEYIYANNYGNVYAIFPIGNFKYLWNPEVYDLYATIRSSSIHPTDIYSILSTYQNYVDNEIRSRMEKTGKSKKEIEGDVIKDFKRDINKTNKKIIKRLVETYKNTDLFGAILSNNEIMIGGNAYYGFRYNKLKHDGTILNILFQYLKKYGTKTPTREMVMDIIK